jgi:hypothetical protein
MSHDSSIRSECVTSGALDARRAEESIFDAVLDLAPREDGTPEQRNLAVIANTYSTS